jgi:hypothetical protein
MERKSVKFVSNGLLNVPDIKIIHLGFVIVPKLDFGNSAYHTKGNIVKRGYVVTDGGSLNVMPGATWFQSVIEARHAIGVLHASRGNAQMFWAMMREAQGLAEYEEV